MLTRRLRPALLVGAISLLPCAAARAQFVTDTPDLAARGRLTLKPSNEFDILQRSAYPARAQNTTTLEIDYGIFRDVEFGVIAPALAVFNARAAGHGTPAGVGDVTLHLKYNFLKECDGSRRPSAALDFNLQLPTADAAEFGSGSTDVYLNGVVQKSLSKKTSLVLNGGLLFAGDLTSGALGVRTSERIFTGGVLLQRQFTGRWLLGVEVTGAAATDSSDREGQLQVMFGGSAALSKRLSVNFGLVGGRFSASPRAGGVIGFEYDF